MIRILMPDLATPKTRRVLELEARVEKMRAAMADAHAVSYLCNFKGRLREIGNLMHAAVESGKWTLIADAQCKLSEILRIGVKVEEMIAEPMGEDENEPNGTSGAS